MPYACVTACYNTGTVTGDTIVGSVSGSTNGQFIACYWVPGGDATQAFGIVPPSIASSTAEFNVGSTYPYLPPWPDTSAAPQWGTWSEDIDNGPYWKPFSSGQYPKLFFEP
jgi:hypothetical protein